MLLSTPLVVVTGANVSEPFYVDRVRAARDSNQDPALKGEFTAPLKELTTILPIPLRSESPLISGCIEDV
jgi:hypothetical protein